MLLGCKAGSERAGAEHGLSPPRDQAVPFSGDMKSFPSPLSYLCSTLLGLLGIQIGVKSRQTRCTSLAALVSKACVYRVAA